MIMTLGAHKNCGQWDVVATIFSIKAPTFERMILYFSAVVSPFLYERYEAQLLTRYPMLRLTTSNNVFSHYPCARYATDASFQQFNMPTGTKAECQEFYSAKHKLHGFKVEVSVFHNGLSINCTRHYRGSVAEDC